MVVEAAFVSALTAIIVLLLTKWMEQKHEKRKESARINKELLNPLRLYLEECYFRTSEIMARLEVAGGPCRELLSVEDPKELSTKEACWFNGEGCYLISSCYFAACLFACTWKIRTEIPYLRLAGTDDSYLLNLILTVSRGFSRDLGIFYAVQHAIGQSMWADGGGRVRGYREFCEALQRDQERVWFDRLLGFYISLGQNQHIDRAKAVSAAIFDLSAFIDGIAGGGPSIRARLTAEQAMIPSFDPLTKRPGSRRSGGSGGWWRHTSRT
jgi:hypothetical protein